MRMFRKFFRRFDRHLIWHSDLEKIFNAIRELEKEHAADIQFLGGRDGLMVSNGGWHKMRSFYEIPLMGEMAQELNEATKPIRLKYAKRLRIEYITELNRLGKRVLNEQKD